MLSIASDLVFRQQGQLQHPLLLVQVFLPKIWIVWMIVDLNYLLVVLNLMRTLVLMSVVIFRGQELNGTIMRNKLIQILTKFVLIRSQVNGQIVHLVTYLMDCLLLRKKLIIYHLIKIIKETHLYDRGIFAM